MARRGNGNFKEKKQELQKEEAGKCLDIFTWFYCI